MKKQLLFGAVLVLLCGCGNQNNMEQPTKQTADEPQTTTKVENADAMNQNTTVMATDTEAVSEPEKTDEAETVVVVIKTSMGTIKAKLYNDTPLHRDNFLKLIDEGWYNGSPFHRVIKDFMIQGGQNADGRLDPGYTVPAEFRSNHFHKKGALAAARQPDQVNPKKASSGSQFYIVQGKVYDENTLDMFEGRMGKIFNASQRQAYTTIGGTPHLDGDYTVFGEVIEGLEVVDKIAAVETGYMDVPVKAVTVISVTIEK
jgi:peptidyl-prolyl cis-trans isomerase B (cyclophilin B)